MPTQASGSESVLYPGVANFICKGSNGKSFRICQLCHSDSTLNLPIVHWWFSIFVSDTFRNKQVCLCSNKTWFKNTEIWISQNFCITNYSLITFNYLKSEKLSLARRRRALVCRTLLYPKLSCLPVHKLLDEKCLKNDWHRLSGQRMFIPFLFPNLFLLLNSNPPRKQVFHALPSRTDEEWGVSKDDCTLLSKHSLDGPKGEERLEF